MPTEFKFYKGKGCEKCNGIGYKGRLGLYEIMSITPENQKIIFEQSLSDKEIEKLAVNDGMITMVQDGILKALAGLTTIEEVIKTTK